jgi:hypothetical protein
LDSNSIEFSPDKLVFEVAEPLGTKNRELRTEGSRTPLEKLGKRHLNDHRSCMAMAVLIATVIAAFTIRSYTPRRISLFSSWVIRSSTSFTR